MNPIDQSVPVAEINTSESAPVADTAIAAAPIESANDSSVGDPPASDYAGFGPYKLPWFQCWAADELASESYLILNAVERGVLESIKKVCWSRGSAPRDPVLIARMCGLDLDDVKLGLTNRVLGHFLDEVKRPGRLVHIALEQYRGEQIKIAKAKKEGGQRGARKTNAVHAERRPAAPVPKRSAARGSVAGDSRDPVSASDSASASSGGVQPRSTGKRHSVSKPERTAEHAAFVEDMEREEAGARGQPATCRRA